MYVPLIFWVISFAWNHILLMQYVTGCCYQTDQIYKIEKKLIYDSSRLRVKLKSQYRKLNYCQLGPKQLHALSTAGEPQFSNRLFANNKWA